VSHLSLFPLMGCGERRADGRLLRRQLDQKWRTLDQFEASLKKLETSKIQWRAKMAIKDGELEAAKVSPLSSLLHLMMMREQVWRERCRA